MMAARSSARPDDERPWEQPGAVRRDCEPHRAWLLHLLGDVGRALGLLTLMCGPVGMAALPLGLVVRRMARHDLEAMRRGLMDPSGEARTRQAIRLATDGAGAAVVLGALWVMMIAACAYVVTHGP
jgi:hypothetical protein